MGNSDFNISRIGKEVVPGVHYKLAAVARSFGVSRSTLYYWIRQGYMKSGVTYSGRRYITGSEILNFYHKYY